MEIKEHTVKNEKAAEVVSNKILVNSTEDALELLGNLYYQGFDTIILNKDHFNPNFFDLKNKIAGDVLQKFSNYRMKLIIIGDFEDNQSKSLGDFIKESNKGKHVNFFNNIEQVILTN